MALEDRQYSGLGTGSHQPWALIADDDPSCLAALEKAFRIQDFRAIGCSDGRQAWAEILKHPYISLVVMNWMLPNLDGHEICRRLKRHRPAIIPVLMVGRSFLRSAWPLMDLQARYVLTKPFPKPGIDHTIGKIANAAFRLRGFPHVYGSEPRP